MNNINKDISKDDKKKNIVVLLLGTNYENVAVKILETSMYLIEKYIGKIINSSYIYKTIPEYLIVDEQSEIQKNIKVNSDEYDDDNKLLKKTLKNLIKKEIEYECKENENNELIHSCNEFDMFLKNKRENIENIENEIDIKEFEIKREEMIEKNNKIMECNLKTYKNTYNTRYFYNLSLVVSTCIEDSISLLIMIKYIEQILKKKKIDEKLKFENRLIDIDVIFFNNYNILQENVVLNEMDIKNTFDKYGYIMNTNIKNLHKEVQYICIPHLYIKYRFSILLCLQDVIPDYSHNIFNNKTVKTVYNEYILLYKQKYGINLTDVNKKMYVLKDELLYLKQKTNIIGILNVNYDSFSDGTLFVEPKKAVHRMFEIINEGADMIDIGGESSAPYVKKNNLISERDLVIPVLKLFREEWKKIKNSNKNVNVNVNENLHENLNMFNGISKKKPLISIDTIHYDVFKECVDNKLVDILNDISACTNEPKIINLLKNKNKYLSVVIMHKRGNSFTMDKLIEYENVVYDIKNYLIEQLNFLVLNGIPRYRIILDIGLGFAKTHDQSVLLLKHINIYNEYPVYIGYSRKRFIGHCVIKNFQMSNKIQNKETHNSNNKEINEEKNNIQNESDKCKFLVNNLRKDKDEKIFQKIICGGLGIAAYAYYKKVDFVRVHDVLETKAVLDILKKLNE